ncbi:MAG: hypothetical protein BWX72_01364 [Firmicutes bacterium ADurb.Bin080]|nr:MAG: hypothetical protein BWX72_01364 [Firmicutes bacterium ADurb.Bin080]
MEIKDAVAPVNIGVLQENQIMVPTLSMMVRPQNALEVVTTILILTLMEAAANIESGHN